LRDFSEAVTDALNGDAVFTYDLTGKRLSVRDAENKTWRFTYDDLGRLASQIDHANRAMTVKTDEAGNVYESTNRMGWVVRAAHDHANRPTRLDFLQDGTLQVFDYDVAGNRTTVGDNGITYLFTFDRLNRLLTKYDSRGRTMAFTYDKANNVLSKTTFQGSKPTMCTTQPTGW
jgi:YD repeat-containing protein